MLALKHRYTDDEPTDTHRLGVLIYLDSIHSGPEYWVVVLDTAPVFGPVGAGEITAIFLQNAHCFQQVCTALQHLQGERKVYRDEAEMEVKE